MTLLEFGGSGTVARNLTSNYAIKPTPEQALRTNRTQPPARLIAALDVHGKFGGSLVINRVAGIMFVGAGMVLLVPGALVLLGAATLNLLAVIACAILGFGLIGVGLFGNDRLKYWASNLMP